MSTSYKCFDTLSSGIDYKKSTVTIENQPVILDIWHVL